MRRIKIKEEKICRWCRKKNKLKLIDEFFDEDVMHYIYICKKCGKYTWKHLVWEKCKKINKPKFKSKYKFEGVE